MNKKILFGIGAVGAAVAACGLPRQIDDTHVDLPSTKIHHPLRIAVLADLHCRRFGKEQSDIINLLKKEQPDLIIIPGDLFDTGRDLEISFELIRLLHDYPVYYTSGNHDNYLDEIQMLRMKLTAEGVHVLEDKGTFFEKGEDTLEIYGLCDSGRKPSVSSDEVSRSFQSDNFRILISHRPEFADFYGRIDCDLIISGHAHGGQWRIPGTHQGVYAPRVGFFPKYTEGVHDLHGRKLVISRGLASGAPFLPRLYNDPEIVLIDLRPEDLKKL